MAKAAAEGAAKPKAAKKPAAKKAAAVAVEGGEEARGTRKLREGIVSSNKMQKTVVIQIERQVQHGLYGKVVLRSNKFKAHDELSCDVGDRVEIMETRPLSKDKRWRVVRIVEKVK